MHKTGFFKDGQKSLENTVVQISISYGDLLQPRQTFRHPSNTEKPTTPFM